jgi:membrane protease YdiL (CAAX protease family)
MLSAKPWKLDSILRLALRLIICMFAGSLFFTVLHYPDGAKKFEPVAFYFLAAASIGCLAGSLTLLGRHWNVERLLMRLVLLLACLYIGLFLGAWAEKLASPGPAQDSTARMLVATLSFQGAGLICVALFLRDHHASWREGFGFDNRWLEAVLYGVLAACIFLPVGQRLQQISAQMLSWISHSTVDIHEQQPVQTIRAAVTWFDQAALGFVTVLLVPVAEESLFRGILYPWIKQAGFPKFAWWGTALAFAAMHTDMLRFMPLFVLALVLTWLYEKTNNLLASITAHSMFNALNFALLLLSKDQIS